METSELEMTPPDSPKATKEKKDAPAPEEGPGALAAAEGALQTQLLRLVSRAECARL